MDVESGQGAGLLTVDLDWLAVKRKILGLGRHPPSSERCSELQRLLQLEVREKARGRAKDETLKRVQRLRALE